MPDYIPGSDSDFNMWQANLLDYLDKNKSRIGLAAEAVTPLSAAQTEWTTALADYVAKQSAVDAARVRKDAARKSYEAAIRAVVRQAQSQPSMTGADRAAMSISGRDSARTPSGVPDSRPAARVDTGQRLRHTVAFTDEETPTSRAKPDGVMGCEVWVKVGDAPPVDPSELRFLGLDTSTPYVATYSGEDAGKTAHYMLRWVNKRGEQGPWSQTVSATIAA